MFQVEAFEDISKIYKEFSQNEKLALHLASDGAHAQLLKAQNLHVSTYSMLVNELFREWHHTFTDLKLISEIKKQIIVHTNPESPVRKQMLLQSKELMISFRFLVEFHQLKLTKQQNESEEAAIFRSIMNTLMELEEVQAYYYARKQLTAEQVAHSFRANKSIISKKIYIYMEDFVDVSRIMLYQTLRNIGFDIVFRIPYEERYPTIHHGWKTIYENLSQTKLENWNIIRNGVPSKGYSFAQKIEGDIPEKEIGNWIKLNVYQHPNELKRELVVNPLKIGKNEMVASDSESLNKLYIKDDSLYFFSSKIGRFFKYLTQCKRKEESIECSYSTFTELITSGWVGEQGVKAQALLIDLEGYMAGVITLGQIRDRLLTLIELQELSQDFERQGRDQIGRNRIKRFLWNPFRVFSYIHRDRYDCTPKQLLDLLNRLERMMNILLLDDNNSVHVNSYIEKVKELYVEVDPFVDGREKERFEEKCLLPIAKDEWKFAFDEIILLFAASFAPDQKKKSQVQENIAETAEIIQSIGNAVSKAITSDHLHITQLSARKFPRFALHLPSYLDYKWLKESITSSFPKEKQGLRLHALLVDYYSRKEVRSFDVYSIYGAIAFGHNVTFSWIDQMTDYDSASVYFQFLQECYGMNHEIDNKLVNEEIEWPNRAMNIETNIESTLEEIPSLYWLDEDFCARKFFYNGIINNQPIYESDFHQRMAFGIIGSLLSQQGEGRKQVEEVLYPLFPQWTNTLKENLLDTEYFYPLRNNHNSFENIQYPKALEKLQRLHAQSKRVKQKSQYRTQNLLVEKTTKSWAKQVEDYQVKAEPGPHCMMCPHVYRCDVGRFAVQND